MREIKFRYWDLLDGKLKYVTPQYQSITSVGVGGQYITIPLDDIVLMQHTGFKDRNGVEIYEGDILRVTDEADEVNALNSDTGIGVVEWLNKWGFWNISNIENGLGDILNWGHVEVIGNIYEYKDL